MHRRREPHCVTRRDASDRNGSDRCRRRCPPLGLARVTMKFALQPLAPVTAMQVCDATRKPLLECRQPGHLRRRVEARGVEIAEDQDEA